MYVLSNQIVVEQTQEQPLCSEQSDCSTRRRRPQCPPALCWTIYRELTVYREYHRWYFVLYPSRRLHKDGCERDKAGDRNLISTNTAC